MTSQGIRNVPHPISRLGASNFQLAAVGTVANNLDLGFYPMYRAAGVSDFYLRLYPQFSGLIAHGYQ